MMDDAKFFLSSEIPSSPSQRTPKMKFAKSFNTTPSPKTKFHSPSKSSEHQEASSYSGGESQL